MQLLVLYYMIAFQNLTNMKKLKLIIFFIITVLSANAQDKPSEEETVQLIQSILNDNTIYTKSGCELSPKTFSIKGMEIRTIEEREDYTYYAYYEKIHWERLDFYEEPKLLRVRGFLRLSFMFHGLIVIISMEDLESLNKVKTIILLNFMPQLIKFKIL